MTDPSSRTFWHVDAFTVERYSGNAAAVVLGGDGLSAEQMQRIAREMNLSETVFVCRSDHPDADYRARIFTLRSEIPFAGHPTVAAAYGVVASGRLPPDPGLLRQECGIGLVPIEVGEEAGAPVFTMTQGRPEYRSAGVDPALAAEMLGCRADQQSR